MPLTKKIPKAMIKIKNQTLILNGIKKVQKYIGNIHITVGYRETNSLPADIKA